MADLCFVFIEKLSRLNKTNAFQKTYALQELKRFKNVLVAKNLRVIKNVRVSKKVSFIKKCTRRIFPLGKYRFDLIKTFAFFKKQYENKIF